MLDLIKEELNESGTDSRHYLSINFESKSLDYINSIDKTYSVIKEFSLNARNKIYLFFDEIQELPGWEKLVNSCMIDFDADIYITGSNAKMLSSELTTYLGGRYVEIKIYPFSFHEVMNIESKKYDNLNIASIFQTYLIYGGMPFLYQLSMDYKSTMQFLNDIYDSIILKDIAKRNKIRDIELLKRIIQFFIYNIGNPFSSTNIVKYLKNEKRSVSTETIYNYIEYCKNACLLHLVQREDVIGKKILKFHEKIYICDHGIREAIYGNNTRDIQQTLENIVYMELLRRDYQVFIGKNNVNEIDFIAKNGSNIVYVQVTYILASDETIKREFSVLERVPDNYPKYVVSMDEIDRSRNGIKHMNIKDFLLSDEY
jgi:predicted AAA+ superfamily ATPase